MDGYHQEAYLRHYFSAKDPKPFLNFTKNGINHNALKASEIKDDLNNDSDK